jgi:hypothetical protein
MLLNLFILFDCLYEAAKSKDEEWLFIGMA